MFCIVKLYTETVLCGFFPDDYISVALFPDKSQTCHRFRLKMVVQSQLVDIVVDMNCEALQLCFFGAVSFPLRFRP